MVEELQESFETQEEAMVGVTLTADATQRVVEALDRARCELRSGKDPKEASAAAALLVEHAILDIAAFMQAGSR